MRIRVDMAGYHSQGPKGALTSQNEDFVVAVM